MIEAVVDISKPQLELRLPAENASLPVVRQGVRSLGEAVRADHEALEDAELAVSEACANVIEHAYPWSPGAMDVTFVPRIADMAVTVTDEGIGISRGPHPAEEGGFGLAMIEGIARQVEVTPRPGGGTEVLMLLDMGAEHLAINGRTPAAAAPLERIARRLAAVVAAQTDMPSDRFLESLLAVELAARHAPGYVRGDRVQLTLDRLPGGFDLRLGPLVTDGAHALVRDSELPVIGSVIERLSDRVDCEPAESALEPWQTERLRLRIASGPPGQA